MHLIIKSGVLEAELEGNPLGTLQKQLVMIAQKGMTDIGEVKSQMDETAKILVSLLAQFSDKSRAELASLQNSLEDEIKYLEEKKDPELDTLKTQVKKLIASSRDDQNKISRLKGQIGELTQKKERKVERPQTQPKRETHEPAMDYLKFKVEKVRIRRNIPGSRYMGRLDFPKSSSERELRESISKAGLTSTSDQIGKLGYRPKLPI